MWPALGGGRAGGRLPIGAALPAPLRHRGADIARRLSRSGVGASPALDRGLGRGHDRHRRLRIHAPGARAADHSDSRYALRGRRWHADPHSVRQLRADHADAKTEARRDGGASRTARRLNHRAGRGVATMVSAARTTSSPTTAAQRSYAVLAWARNGCLPAAVSRVTVTP